MKTGHQAAKRISHLPAGAGLNPAWRLLIVADVQGAGEVHLGALLNILE